MICPYCGDGKCIGGQGCADRQKVQAGSLTSLGATASSGSNSPAAASPAVPGPLSEEECDRIAASEDFVRAEADLRREGRAKWDAKTQGAERALIHAISSALGSAESSR